MPDTVPRLTLKIDDALADSQGVEELTSGLRDELRAMNADVSAATAGPAPEGTRAIELVALGTLVVALAKSDVLAAVINAVSSWLSRDRQRSIKLELDGDVLELTGLPSADQRRMTEVWLARHQAQPDPAQVAPSAGARHALIIASNEFQDPGLRRLRAPAQDAEALARVLRDPAIGGFEVRTLLNEPAPTVNEAIEDFFADRSPDDLLLLHFSSHGVKDDEGELYFATSTTKLNRLGATGIAADFVNRRMNRSRSRRIVLLLDCCYAGAFGRGMVARAGLGMDIQEQFGGRGRAVITASNAMEYAFEGAELADSTQASPSVFTSALVEGLETGDADLDQDGFVGLDELYDFVYDRVRQTTPNQTPGKWTFDVQGDLHIARRSRPVTKPSPLPAELQAAVAHPLAGVRAGAVAELGRLLRSQHGGLSLAASMALQELIEDDSRTVSAAAAAVLDAAAAQTQVAPVQRPAARQARRQAPATAAVAPEPAPAAYVPAPAAEPTQTAKAALPSQPQHQERVETSAAAPVEPAARAADAARSDDRAMPVGPGADPGPWHTRIKVMSMASAAVLVIATFLRAGDYGEVDFLTHLVSFWVWLLIAAVLVFGLTHQGSRERAVAQGAVFSLAGGALGVAATFHVKAGYLVDAMLTFVVLGLGVLLCLATVSLDALTRPGNRRDRLGWAALVLAVVAVVTNLSFDLDSDDGDPTVWLAVVPLTVLALLVVFAVRIVQRWRRDPVRLSVALSAVAIVLMVATMGWIIFAELEGYDAGATAIFVPTTVIAVLTVILFSAHDRLLWISAWLVLGASLFMASQRLTETSYSAPDGLSGDGLSALVLATLASAAVATLVASRSTAGEPAAR